jgi:hypothetical protein
MGFRVIKSHSEDLTLEEMFLWRDCDRKEWLVEIMDGRKYSVQLADNSFTANLPWLEEGVFYRKGEFAKVFDHKGGIKSLICKKTGFYREGMLDWAWDGADSYIEPKEFRVEHKKRFRTMLLPEEKRELRFIAAYRVVANVSLAIAGIYGLAVLLSLGKPKPSNLPLAFSTAGLMGVGCLCLRVSSRGKRSLENALYDRQTGGL